MDNKKDDAYYIEKIKQSLSYIISKTQDWTIERFYEEEDVQYAVLFHLIQVSENAKKLSEEFRQRKDIQWVEIIGLRNKIVHDYDGVDLDLVFDIVEDDVPELLEIISNLP